MFRKQANRVKQKKNKQLNKLINNKKSENSNNKNKKFLLLSTLRLNCCIYNSGRGNNCDENTRGITEPS